MDKMSKTKRMHNLANIFGFHLFYKKANNILLYNIGQGQWVSLVGLGGGDGGGGCGLYI